MRWNAMLAAAVLVSASLGCSLNKKKNAEPYGGGIDEFGLSTPYVDRANTVEAPRDSGLSGARSYESTHPEFTSTMASAEPVPSFAPSQVRYHTVARRDTLFSIARRHYNDASKWKDIYAANRDLIGSDPNRIFVGQQLIIP